MCFLYILTAALMITYKANCHNIQEPASLVTPTDIYSYVKGAEKTVMSEYGPDRKEGKDSCFLFGHSFLTAAAVIDLLSFFS